MIKERLKKGDSFGIEGYSLSTYNPQHKQHIGFKKWSTNKIPDMYDNNKTPQKGQTDQLLETCAGNSMLKIKLIFEI